MDEQLKTLRELGEEFERVAVAAERGGRWRRFARRHVLLLSVLGLTSLSAGAVAASSVLTGEPVEDPPGVQLKADEYSGVLEPDTAQLTSLRVADPAGGPPWGLRTFRTTRQFGCVQIGRVVDDRLGVLGVAGAFDNDRRFHEKVSTLLGSRDCQPLDGAGRLFLTMSIQGLPASATHEGCVVERPPKLVVSEGRPDPTAGRPLCAREDLRRLHYGTLGPEGVAVTYRDARGRLQTARAVGPDGAYLVVTRPRSGRRVSGWVTSPTPRSGLVEVRYRDGSTCRIADPTRIGGARACPAKGYTRPMSPAGPGKVVRAAVRATVSPQAERPKEPNGEVVGPSQWKLTIAFRAPVGGDAHSYYTTSVAPRRATACQFGGMSGAIARDVRAGETVRQEVYVPARCTGMVDVRVGYHRPGSEPEQTPFAGLRPDDPVVGRAAVRLPG